MLSLAMHGADENARQKIGMSLRNLCLGVPRDCSSIRLQCVS